ncbi:peptide/nickel transport system substrate-binding protein [Salsuginibacillus halophilus]|uniref:Peptide/nickel transport system substrate-binding protein n=1 Tax=Salsuginibacillus halophilus TaxID=517424 RepID=A0A2P8HIB3_9BACI|nr:ABC transporter substrate-binding protein [Salsuginibacillus halophilus]PSL45958.1 peptide/nickel transport system substrate-binding protein [Salsuginibacillus halophilus]
MKQKSLWYLLIAMLTFGLLLAACGGDPDEFEEEEGGDGVDDDPIEEDDDDDDDDATEEDEDGDEEAGEPQDGGNVNLAMYSAPEHQFNPIYYTSSYDNNIIEFMYESLFTQDEDLEFYNQLAEDTEMNDDQTEFVVTLRDDVEWHDGEPFTAEDVEFTYTTIADPDYIGVRQSYADDLAGYEEFNSGETDEFEGVEATGEHEVTFRWDEPTVTEHYETGFPIIPKHVFEDYNAGQELEEADESSEAGQIVGTGPFSLEEVTEGESYVLEANENYWGGEPNLDTVTWEVIDQAVMTGLLENGDIHGVFEPDGVAPTDIDNVEQLDNITLYQPQDLGYQYLGFKMAHRPSEDVEAGTVDTDNFEPNEKLQDKEVRQAIAYALDREGMVEGLLHGSGQVLHAPFPEASWAYDEDAPVRYDQDPEAAQELLAEAGYEDVTDDGFVEDPDGEEFVLNLEYPTGNEPRERAAIVIQENLEEVGINVDLQDPREFSAHADRVEEDAQEMDMYLMGWSLASGDPDPSNYFQSDQPYNYTRWNDETSDQLLQDATAAPDAFEDEYREEVYAEWANHVSEELPKVFLWSMINNFAYADSFGGVTENPVNMYKDTHEWYIEE